MENLEGKGKKRRSGFLKKAVHPEYIRQTNINNVNVYSQMHELKETGSHIYQKYERVIAELQAIIKELQSQNSYLHHEKRELLKENIMLKDKIHEGSAATLWNKHSQQIIRIKKTNKYQLQHIYHNCSANDHSYLYEESKVKSVLDESQVETIMTGYVQRNNHCLNISVDPHLQSIDKEEHIRQQLTPKLGGVNPTHVQCSSIGNEAPLRVFYMLLLQNKSSQFLVELEKHLELLNQDDSYLLHPYYCKNELWTFVLKNFFQTLRNGEFSTSQQVIDFINQNKLIDILMISLLKFMIDELFNQTKLRIDEEGIENESSSFMDPQINHHKLFLGLANKFDLSLEKRTSSSEYLFYPEEYGMKYEESQFLDSNMAELQISLNKNKPSQIKISSSEMRQRDPLFRVKLNKEKKAYQFSLIIQYDANSCKENDFFRASPESSQKSESEFGESELRSKQNMHASLPPPCQMKSVLGERDMNLMSVLIGKKPTQKKYEEDCDQFLLPEGEQEKFFYQNRSYRDDYC